MKKRVVICFSLFLFTFAAIAGKQVKVACVGNSITFGAALPDRKTQAYPVRLQELLGNGYIVENFGKSGTTLLSQGHRPYIRQEEYQKALAFAADIVVIHLGINDTDPRNWPHYRDSFLNDYLALIKAFRTANPNCRILIARLTPISDRHPRFKSGTRDWRDEIQTAIERIARIADVQLIDFEEPLSPYPFMLPDAVHPDPEGAKKLAKIVYSSITGDFGGLQMPAIYTDHMVLQRNRPLKIKGIADAGALVTVSIDKQKHMVKTGSDGHWTVTLLPLKSGGPYVLKITDGKEKLQYEDVLAGEVWLCSGQSNMEFVLKNSSTGSEDIPKARNNHIRLFNMKARWQTSDIEWDKTVLDSLNHLQYYRDTQWEPVSPESASDFSAVAYYFGKMLQDSLHVPVGLICNAVGGSPAESWIDRVTLEHQFPDILRNWKENDFIQEWVRNRAIRNIGKSESNLQRHPYEPCYLYESGIRPLEQFPISGVIWYQGESNAHNTDVHAELFRLLINSWRKNWGNNNLPFYYVQLSSIDRPSWTWFRDSQLKLMKKIPDTGMAVSSDHGDSLDVHPTYKKPVGERLACWALNKTYNQKHVTPSGPLFRNAECKDGIVYITFDYAEGMHSSDGNALRTFEVAEIDGLYEPASAEIKDNYIKVYSDKIKNPRYVRYAWQPFTRANLVNGAELPASTFRAEIPDLPVRLADIQQTKGFPDKDKDFAKGVSACFAGMSNGQLLIGGGCNFPGIPAADGGAKKYYRDIYVAEITGDSLFTWRKAGEFPHAVAYGVSVSTSGGILCIGGMNTKGSLNTVYRITLEDKKAKAVIETLPALPCTLDNMTGAMLGNTVYIAGGNKNGIPCNDLYCLDLDDLERGWRKLRDFPGPPRIQAVSATQSDTSGEQIFCLWGGFATPNENNPATLSVNGYAYSPTSGKWTPLPVPIDSKGDTISLGGGTALALSDSLVLCTGGVHKDIFLQALRYAAPGYLSHPAEWYRFNNCLMVYNTHRKQWKEIAKASETARAGASFVFDRYGYLLINGELKPGIRTPDITRILLRQTK